MNESQLKKIYWLTKKLKELIEEDKHATLKIGEDADQLQKTVLTELKEMIFSNYRKFLDEEYEKSKEDK